MFVEYDLARHCALQAVRLSTLLLPAEYAIDTFDPQVAFKDYGSVVIPKLFFKHPVWEKLLQMYNMSSQRR